MSRCIVVVMSVLQQIAEIEKEMSRTQKNKATEGVRRTIYLIAFIDPSPAQHLGTLKAKLAKLRSQLIEAATGTKGEKGEGFDVMKSGDARVLSQCCMTNMFIWFAQVALIGFPSVGKSTLLSTITKTKSEVILLTMVRKVIELSHMCCRQHRMSSPP